MPISVRHAIVGLMHIIFREEELKVGIILEVHDAYKPQRRYLRADAHRLREEELKFSQLYWNVKGEVANKIRQNKNTVKYESKS